MYQITYSSEQAFYDGCYEMVKRGLLCASCNIGLGKFKDSPELLASALKYLQENQ